MENNTQILQQLADSNRKQLRLARIQCLFTVASAIFCLLFLLSVVRILPQIQELAGQISGLSNQAETVLTNLETVSDELTQADIGSMVSNVDTLAQTSLAGIQQALEKVNAIDIQTLNKAIADLAKVVAPLADLTQRLESIPFLK